MSECGTMAGHSQHRNRGEQPCEPCRAVAFRGLTREQVDAQYGTPVSA